MLSSGHAEATVEAPVVVPVDPAAGRELHIRDRLEWPVVEHRGADAFGFVEAIDRLHQGVIVGVADGPD